MRLALTADWLTSSGGAEQVLASLLSLYSERKLYTTVYKSGTFPFVSDDRVVTSSLQPIYRRFGKYRQLLPLLPSAIEEADLTGYDVVLSSSHAVGKGIIPPPGALHVCYCHTPVRYAWEMQEEYLEDFGIPKRLRPFIRRRLENLRRWDLTTAQRTDVFIANSTTTQERIQRIYGRESVVVPPPVDDRFFQVPLSQATHDSYFLAVGRFVPYKRFDLLIEAANKRQLPLKIAGKGPDEERLKKLAGPTVEFLGFVPDEELPGLYANATCFLFPQEEDAGIVLLEAHAAGAPALAFHRGGARDAIIPGTTGCFFEEHSVDALLEGLDRFLSHTWNRETIREHAQQYHRRKFEDAIRTIVDSAYAEFRTRHPLVCSPSA